MFCLLAMTLSTEEGKATAREAVSQIADVEQPTTTEIAEIGEDSLDDIKIASNMETKWTAISMEATAYTKYDAGCTAYTYSGNDLKRGLVAVDPTVIPLGTKLYIPGYGYAIADDIGGAIKGHKIDLSMDTLDEAFTFGRRQITVYIIDSPLVV